MGLIRELLTSGGGGGESTDSQSSDSTDSGGSSIDTGGLTEDTGGGNPNTSYLSDTGGLTSRSTDEGATGSTSDSGGSTSGGGQTATEQATSTGGVLSGAVPFSPSTEQGVLVWDTASDTSSALGVTLDSDVRGEPGLVKVEGRVSGKLGISLEQWVGDASDDSVVVKIRPGESVNSLETKSSKINSEVNDQINSVKSSLENARTIFNELNVPNSYSFNPVPTIEGLPNQRLPLWYGIYGNKEGGKTPVEFSSKVEFEPVKVPVTDDSGFDVTQLPSIPITVEVVPLESVQKALSTNVFSTPQVTLEISPRSFVKTVSVEDTLPCIEKYPELNSMVRKLEQDSSSLENRANSSVSTLESVSNELTSSVSGFSDIDSLESNMNSLTLDDFSGMNRSDLRQSKSRVSNTVVNFELESEIKSTLSDARNKLSSIQEDSCLSDFSSRISEVAKLMDEISAQIDRAESMRSTLMSIFSSVEVGTCADAHPKIEQSISNLENKVSGSDLNKGDVREIQSSISELEKDMRSSMDTGGACYDQFDARLETVKSELIPSTDETDPRDNVDIPDVDPGSNVNLPDCSDVSNEVKNRVSGFEAEVDEFISRDERLVTPKRYSSLMKEAGKVLAKVNSEVKGNNTCRGKLRGRVKTARSKLKEFWQSTKGGLSCEQKNPQLAKSIQRFREQSASVDPRQKPQKAKKLAEQGERIAKRVEENASKECRERLVEDISVSVENLDPKKGQFSINKEKLEEAEEESEEIKDARRRVLKVLDRTRGPQGNN